MTREKKRVGNVNVVTMVTTASSLEKSNLGRLESFLFSIFYFFVLFCFMIFN